MEGFIFENLLVYKKSLALSVDLVKMATKFPIMYSRLRDQLIGAATSIPLNIAEGSGRVSFKDRNNFFRTARASSFECVAILAICHEMGLVANDFLNDCRLEISNISKMIFGLIKSQGEI